MRFALVAAGLPVVLACQPPRLPADPPAGCVLAEPARRFILPSALREISGLAVLRADEILAHDDNRARVFVLDPATAAVRRTFTLHNDPRADFEGIAVAGDTVYLMTSTGLLYAFADGADGEAVPWTVLDTGLGQVCELEGLAWDPRDQVLLLPCKAPRRAGAPVGLVLFRWSPRDRSLATPATIEVSPATIGRVVGSRAVRPTSVELDPLTGRLLVLSSRPRVILELDRSGAVYGAAHMRPALHPQPEGLTLLPGALLVADEGPSGPGTLTVYPCRN